MDCRVPYPSDPPRVRAVRLGPGNTVQATRDVPIFLDDTVETALVKIAAAFGPVAATGPAPYVWKSKQPLAFNISATAWRPGYQVNPFKVTPEAAAAETAALAPTVTYQLKALVRTRIGEPKGAADAQMVYVAFPEDVPAALRANAHYFGIAQSALRRPREVAKETEQLLALWTQPTAAHPETPCHFNRVTFQADVPAPSAPAPLPRAHATDIQSLYERLHARVADFSLIQWVADPTRVLYKLAENHTIPPAFLETWTSADRIPAAGPMLQMYSLLPGRAERDLFAKIVITPTKIRIVYHLDPREKIGADDLYPHAERLRRRLEDLYGTSLTFTETELSARTDIALPGLTVPRFAKIASGLRGVFQVIQLTKANTLDMLAVRTENYATVEISDYIASKLRLGIPQDVIYAELSDIGETDAAIQDALDRARDIVRATPGILPPAELQRRVQTGLHVFISFAGFGLRVQLNGALHRADLTRTLHWIRCIAIKTATEAPVPAAAAPVLMPPVPAEAVAGPSRRPLSPPLPAAAAAPAVPAELISPAVSVTSEEDLSFLEGGAVGREDQRYFLSHLQAADPKLFLDAEGYAAKCGATPFRQPIVVSKGEKATMDAEGYGTAYDSAIEYGSDAAHQNIYMCPRIWCQVSRRPLTLEQYRTTGCPRKEKPMLLYNHSYWNNAPETPHHISFHKDRTKTGLCMPCCGIKPVKAAKLAECAATPGTPSRPRGLPAAPLVAPKLAPSAAATPTAPSTGLTTGVAQTPGARKKEEKNLLQQRAAIPEGRYGTVPKPIHDILLPNTAYQLCTTTLIREECAVRRGVASPAAPGDDAFLPALLYILDFPSTEAFAKALRRRLDPITFMTLENGRILQAFAPTDPMYPEDLTANERREFYRWLREQTAYRKRFQLPDPDALPLYAASRELALYHAYEAFFAHLLAPEEPKNPYTFYDIARLFGVALILWERTGPQVAQIRCPYFQTTEELLRRIGDSADEPRVAMILQDGAERAAVYEPIELRKVSGTAEQKLTQARVGHRFLKDTLVRGCTGTAAGAATDGLGALRALAQWIETMVYDPTAFRLRTLVLAPDLSVSRVVTEVGVHVLLPVAMRPSPRELNAALTLLPTIRNILHHEDLQGTTRRVECLDRDLTQFRNKLRDLGLGDEAGRAPEAAPAGVFSSIFTVPPPDPQDVFPILLAGTRGDADLQRVAEETERSREIRRMEQRVGQTLLFYHDTLVAPLLGRPRSYRVQTLANTFPDVPVAQRARLHQIIESLPLDSPETLAAHLRNISIAPRLPFHTPEIHLQRERKDRSGQWVFSQAAVETGLPSAMMQPIAPGSARPRGEKLPQPIHERIRAAEAAPVASARPRPALLSDVAEKAFPVKWTDIRAYSWSSFKILHRIEQQPTDIPAFFAWLSGELRVPLVWSEVQFATFQAISRALRDAAATEAVSDDPNFRNAWLRRAGRAPTTGRTQFSKLIERTNAADRQRLWTEIGPATVAAWPADTTLLMTARLLDISILLLLERARPTGPLRRGGLEDLAASSIFLTGADDLKSVLQRPLVLFFKELGDAHFTYSVIETPAHQPYFQMAGEAPKDVQKLIQTHLIAQKE